MSSVLLHNIGGFDIGWCAHTHTNTHAHHLMWLEWSYSGSPETTAWMVESKASITNLNSFVQLEVQGIMEAGK